MVEGVGGAGAAAGEACVTEGEALPCYPGDPATRMIGQCRDGTMLCRNGLWGPCEGFVLGSVEECNGLDDDCNGAIDDLPACGAGGVGGQGGGGAGPTCGLIDGLGDDFDDDAIDGRWRESIAGGAALFEAGGDLVFSLDSDASEAAMRSDTAYDLRERSTAIEIDAMPRPGVGFSFGVGSHEAGRARFAIDASGVLSCGYETAEGEEQILATDIASATAHRHLRFRHAGTRISFDLSADGSSWTERASHDVADLFDARYAFLFLAADTEGTGSVEQVRVARAWGELASSPSCPISTFVDDFEDGQQDARWVHGWGNTDYCEVREIEGELRIECVPTDVRRDVAVASAAAYDLTNGAFSVELTRLEDAEAGTYAELYLSAGEDWDGYWGMGYDDGSLWAGHEGPGDWVDLVGEPFDPGSVRFWRLREQSGQSYVEVSADAGDWVVLAELATPFDMSSVRVWLSGGTRGSPQPVSVRFDNVNLLP